MRLFNTIVSNHVKTNVLVNSNIFHNNVVMKFSERIVTARKYAKLSVEELAFKTECSSDLIRKLEAGTRKGTTFSVKIALACGVSPTWLDTGDGEMIERKSDSTPMLSTNVNQTTAEYVTKIIDLENNEDYPAIRKVSLKLSAGIVGFSIEHDIEDKTPMVMGKEWFEKRGYNPSKLLAVKVKGDSMAPRINDCDTVVINTADAKPLDGIVFAVNYEGELLIKRLVRDAGLWWLASDNPDQRLYPRKQCEGDLCLILGRIVHKQSEII